MLTLCCLERTQSTLCHAKEYGNVVFQLVLFQLLYSQMLFSVEKGSLSYDKKLVINKLIHRLIQSNFNI